MGEIAEAMIDGNVCELCLMPFVDSKGEPFEHGYPATCIDCWNKMTPEQQKSHQLAEENTI